MKRSFFALTFFILVFHTIYSFSQESPEQLQKIVDNHIQKFMQEKNIPGVTVALFYNNKGSFYNYGVADRKTNKPVTENTIFEMASVTKVFNSTALAVEVLRGKMQLNDPITKYLPPLHANRETVEQVNLQELATHFSSLPTMPDHIGKLKHGILTVAQVMNYLQNWKPAHPIGTNYEYSNLGFGLLGFAVANVEHTNYNHMLHMLVLNPLNMNSSGSEIPEHLMHNYSQGYSPQGKPVPRGPGMAFEGGGMMRSTGADMLKFLEANLGVSGPAELKKAMQFAQKGITPVSKHLTMGLAWQNFTKDDLLFIDKNGGIEGYSSYIGMIPDQKMGIVLISNMGRTQITEVGREILTVLANSSKKGSPNHNNHHKEKMPVEEEESEDVD